jgi:hypothetical protein
MFVEGSRESTMTNKALYICTYMVCTPLTLVLLQYESWNRAIFDQQNTLYIYTRPTDCSLFCVTFIYLKLFCTNRIGADPRGPTPPKIWNEDLANSQGPSS